MAVMFKILGADGKEYGPVTVDQIKKWISEGRANRETMAQQAGDSAWKPLGQFTGFADVLGGPPPVASATLAVATPVPLFLRRPLPWPRPGPVPTPVLVPSRWSRPRRFVSWSRLDWGSCSVWSD